MTIQNNFSVTLTSWRLFFSFCRFQPFPVSIQMWSLHFISYRLCKPFTPWTPSSPRFRFPWMSICPRLPLRRTHTSHLRSQRTCCLPRCSSLMFTQHLQGQHCISSALHLHDWHFCWLCNLIDKWEDGFKQLHCYVYKYKYDAYLFPLSHP